MDLTTLGEHGEVERRRSFKGHRTSSSIIIGFLFLPKTTNEDTWRSRAFPDPNPYNRLAFVHSGVHAMTYVRRRRASCFTDQAPLPPSPPP